MTHECDDCGEAFETLSRLRLHNCPSTQSGDTSNDQPAETDPTDEMPDGEPGLNRHELKRSHPDIVGELPSLVADAQDGNVAGVSRAIAEYERTLTTVAETDVTDEENLYSDIQFAYYEEIANALDDTARTDGWDTLVEFADAYAPTQEDGFPEVGHVIANAIGRAVIRTRQSEGVDNIPSAALAFLVAIPEHVDEFHIAYEEAYTYGWCIGHTTHSVGDHLLELATDEPKFVKITLNTAFYVDQHAALDVFESLVTETDLSGTRSILGMETDLTEFYFRAVADLETDALLGPHAPPYWEGDDELVRSIELDPDVKQRLRDLAYTTGVADGLPADWSLQDLEGGPMSDILHTIGDESRRS